MKQFKCPVCGKISSSVSRVCPYCGSFLGEDKRSSDTGDRGIMQLERETERNTVKVPKARSKKKRARKQSYYYRKHVVNWAWVFAGLLILLFITLVAGYAYLKLTPKGQVILARAGKDASAEAYWTIGEEYLNTGAIPKAIEACEKAFEMEPENPKIFEHSFLLAEVYETAGMEDEAMEVYAYIYTNLKGEGETIKAMLSSAYRSHIRILSSQGFEAQAADLMQQAYEHTGDTHFYKERSQLVPSAPTTNLSGGPYLFNQKLEFYSDGGYDIYYATADEVLPEEGTLYTEPILLTEGVYKFRAICVSKDLISNEMQVKYNITLPRPTAPKSNRQPGEYNKPFKVMLRNIGDDPDVRMYYTVDGSRPTTNSPEFTDEGILIPAGRIRLRAIAINKYGKESNELQIEYKVKGKTEKYFSGDDKVASMAIMEYDYQKFVERFGSPINEVKGEDSLVKGTATLLTYPWGEARFTQREVGNVLYYLDTVDSSMTGPRNTAIGQSLSEITSKFRDKAQPAGPFGDRGLYYDQSVGYGAYTASPDDPSDGALEYFYQDYNALHTGSVLLVYHIKEGKAERITYSFTDFMQPNVR